MGASIYIADDEKNIRDLITKFLESDGYSVTAFETGDELMEEFLKKPCELVILDIMMPGTDGITWCKKIRRYVDCPILFLTAKAEEKSIMEGLGSGGDDYICKPFGIGELRARVAAHLRREAREKTHAVEISGVRFDLAGKSVQVGEEKIPLTKSEYEISELLALNHGQVFSKEKIFESVFGYERESDSSAITEHVKNIRAKFARYGKKNIQTVWGIGYKWE